MATPTLQQLVASVLALVLASGCGSSATLTLRDGSRGSGRIVRSDQHTVLVERDGVYYPVKREDIVDVEHPGTGAIVAGGVLLGIAGLLTVAASRPDERDDASTCRPENGECGNQKPLLGNESLYVVAALFAVPALGLGAYGAASKESSQSRYAPPKKTQPPPPQQSAPPPSYRYPAQPPGYYYPPSQPGYYPMPQPAYYQAPAYAPKPGGR